MNLNDLKMKEYYRMKLWGLSFGKSEFKQELIRIVESSDGESLLDLMIYCYEKYSDMHPEILAEVFAEYEKQLNPSVAAQNI